MYLSPERPVVSWSLRALGLSEDPKDAQRQPQCFPDAPTCSTASCVPRTFPAKNTVTTSAITALCSAISAMIAPRTSAPSATRTVGRSRRIALASSLLSTPKFESLTSLLLTHHDPNKCVHYSKPLRGERGLLARSVPILVKPIAECDQNVVKLRVTRTGR